MIGTRNNVRKNKKLAEMSEEKIRLANARWEV
jgi:hypothetical protein